MSNVDKSDQQFTTEIMDALTVKQVEKLIRISKTKPLLPEKFVPWNDEPKEDDIFLPEELVSLAGHPLYDTLSPAQKKELARHEVVQVMYSYAWSEGLACTFFNRHLMTLQPDNIEYRFLLRELIEEYRHQDMFSSTILKLGGKPIPPGWIHRFIGKQFVQWFPADLVFISVLAVELITDVYGKFLRRNKNVYSVLRKTSELHNIEEGRHIFYTQLWLKRYTEKAGVIRRSLYSLVVLFNILFMRTLYVRSEIFERIGAENPKELAKVGRKNLKKKFGKYCLKDAIKFTKSFNGFNAFTRPFWRFFLNAKV